MNRTRTLWQTFVVMIALFLFGCGSYHNVVLYEPSSVARTATFVPGDGCTNPGYRFGTISSTRKAMVFINVINGGGQPQLELRVTIEGNSKFAFLDDKVIISTVEKSTNTSTILGMNNFQFSTGGGRYSKREVRPLDEFSGPPRASFKPYYPENPYEREQWSFASQMTLNPTLPERFSVQIPRAVIDGENLSFPLVTFQRREIGHRILCLR